MPISRLRLRLAAGFGAAFLLGLLVLDVGFFAYVRRKAEAKLTREVATATQDLAQAIAAERDGKAGAQLEEVVSEVLGEWPPGPDAIAIYDGAGRRLGARGDSSRVRLLDSLARNPGTGTRDLARGGKPSLRAGWAAGAGSPPFLVATASSTFAMREDEEALVAWLLVSVPLIALGAAGAGYVMARYALRPVLGMARELDAIDPERIDRRLPVGHPADELDQLASHFNGLLDRLAGARETSRRFLAEAAHQLRTPLTIVRGESALGLDRPRSTDDYLAALRRINLSAEQMSRRVGELFLLAEAEAGELPDLTERVELDGVVMEAADLMRGRAASLGRSLEFGVMDDVVVQGAEALLREAVMELLENACRHGSAERPVQIAVRREGPGARVEVTNAGPAFPAGASQGLGLPIVRWVAEIHGGDVGIARRDPLNTVTMGLPLGFGSAS